MSAEQIGKAKEHGAIAVLSLLEHAGLAQRLMIVRAMRGDGRLQELSATRLLN
ncbi:hypothetical protein [Pseudomonas aeruginosa]|uniref:hypothetical protein n=1 Tax=Pseudomonas aeruginosa TaxID=287 RepID=UPI001F04138C|nr:hypothetical protein [Pseudomonas aeruginosa]